MVGSFYFVWRFWLAGIDGGMKDYEGRSSPACHFEREREIFEEGHTEGSGWMAAI